MLLAGPAYESDPWESFAVAEVGAAAALAGLLVVACSINIARIIETPALVQRLGATLTQFTGILVVGSLLLVPGQPRWLQGTEMAVVGLIVAGLVFMQRGLQGLEPQYRRSALTSVVLATVAALMLATGGAGYATESIGGLYWLVPGMLLGFAIGLLNAWVALVEILR
ncbi:hypothetical protein [Dactylosporangium sp. CA-092794]|uniref:hypothetical protein n=1 Tax=Dactylosporangium sp. CA-092794 TaxID=3239929 RepID=UPI003D913D70